MRKNGFTMVEVMVVMTILAIAMMSLALTDFTNVKAMRDLKARDSASSLSSSILERLSALPFGAPNAKAPTAAQLDTVLGSDIVLGAESGVSLSSLTKMSPLTFRLEGVECKGDWAIYIDNDLDGDGVVRWDDPSVEDENDGSREGRTDLYRVLVEYNGRVMVNVMRTMMPHEAVEGVVLD